MGNSNLYISPFKEKRNGTFDYPVLQSIHKTQPCTGRVSFFLFDFLGYSHVGVFQWYTPVTWIMEMDKGYFHIRKDGIVATDRDLILLKCNNGSKACKWRGQMRTTDRTGPWFFDSEFSVDSHLTLLNHYKGP